MTVRELISDVKQSMKAVNMDDRLSNRYIYSKLIKYAALLIKRESDRKIYKQNNLFRPIRLELEDYYEYKRSTKPLPDFFTTSDGPLLIVGSVDHSNKFDNTDPVKYARTLTREFTNPNKKYFWIEDQHLIIPDAYLQVLTVRGLFFNYKDPEVPCQSILDTPFPLPEYLKEETINLTMQALMTRAQIVEDEDPNLDNNKK